MKGEVWCNVGKRKYWVPKKIEICQPVLDEYCMLRFLVHSNAVKRTGFTVFGAADGNSDEWIQYATEASSNTDTVVYISELSMGRLATFHWWIKNSDVTSANSTGCCS